MKCVIDTHCHTMASGHAYSTVIEVAREANNKGLKIVGITDHGPNMPGASDIFHIINQKVIPEKIFGVDILKGVEANIIDYSGKLDISDDVLENLDLVIASLHDICIEPKNKGEHTNALLMAMENDKVDIIAHPGNPAFPIDKEKVVLGAKSTNTIIEINNSSLGKSRVGSLENCKDIARLCKTHGVRIMLGSDAHIAFDVGKFDKAIDMLNEIKMPKELILNLYPGEFISYLKEKGKNRFKESIETPLV